MKYFLATLLLVNSAIASDSFLKSVKKMKWKDLDVVWIEDDKFPKFTASIYFQDGALNEPVPGTTQLAFDQMTSGTKKENQRELAEFFDFYGASLRRSVTHEYSVFSVQALTKDIKPVMEKVCEIFNDAQYPKDELQSHISRMKSQLRNLVTSHGALADRVYRKISLANTPYAEPVEGTLASFDKITSESLKERLGGLNKTRKVLYLAGPSDVKDIREVIEKKCNWKNEFKAKVEKLSKPSEQSAIYLVEVPNANQAQIRIGRYLTDIEFEGKYDKLQFMASFLGGGFTSKLIQELRVKRGLTYSAGAYASMQRDYGRAGISTFSKNDTAAEAVGLIREILSDVVAGKFEDKEFTHQINHQMGGYAFGFEQMNAFLGQLMLYDHQGRKYDDLVDYPNVISKMTRSELSSSTMEVFNWNKQTIVIVGDKSLEKSVSKIRPVRVIKYEDYL